MTLPLRLPHVGDDLGPPKLHPSDVGQDTPSLQGVSPALQTQPPATQLDPASHASRIRRSFSSPSARSRKRCRTSFAPGARALSGRSAARAAGDGPDARVTARAAVGVFRRIDARSAAAGRRRSRAHDATRIARTGPCAPASALALQGVPDATSVVSWQTRAPPSLHPHVPLWQSLGAQLPPGMQVGPLAGASEPGPRGAHLPTPSRPRKKSGCARSAGEVESLHSVPTYAPCSCWNSRPESAMRRGPRRPRAPRVESRPPYHCA